MTNKDPIQAAGFTLTRTPFGKLQLTTVQGVCHANVVPVRAFPVQSPDHGIALVSQDGKELVWIDALSAVNETERTLIHNELATREFMPEITKIVGVTSFSTPCTWTVETDRGPTECVLRGDEDIRRVGSEGRLLVADSHSIQYLVRDHLALDAHSKKLLDRFL